MEECGSWERFGDFNTLQGRILLTRPYILSLHLHFQTSFSLSYWSLAYHPPPPSHINWDNIHIFIMTSCISDKGRSKVWDQVGARFILILLTRCWWRQCEGGDGRMRDNMCEAMRQTGTERCQGRTLHTPHHHHQHHHLDLMIFIDIRLTDW